MLKHLFLFTAYSVLFGVALWGCQGGETVFAVAVHPTRVEVVYAATSDGLFKSGDGGLHWQKLEEGLGPFQVLSIAIDPVQPSTLYVGTASDGVYRSLNGGAHWASVNQGMRDYTMVVNALVFDRPSIAATLYAATTIGVYKTDNMGESWQRVSQGLESLYVVALLAAPDDPRRLYAGTSGGVYISTNGAERWGTSNDGLVERAQVDAMALGVNCIVPDPKDPAHLYAGTARGLYQSADRGAHWTPMTVEDPFVVSVTATQNGHLYAAGKNGVHHSADAGKTWTTSLKGAVRAVATHPQHPDRLYVGGGKGLFATENGGQTWRALPIRQSTR